jgi:glutaredoxin-related protein
MARLILSEERLHNGTKNRICEFHRNTVEAIIREVDAHPVVVVGMAHNPYCKKARKLLDKAGLRYHYLEYGSYTREWKRRLAIKMWSGWPTFPMVFVNGQLIGGKDDLEKMLASGELKK